MAQQGFGRRNVPSRSAAARPAETVAAATSADAGHPLDASPSSSTGRSIAVMACVVVAVTVAAGGLAYALNTAGGNDRGSSTVATAPAPSTCDPNKDKCVNQYQVALACNGEEHKSVHVNAETAGEAEAKAERHNRGCRSRGSAFVAAMLVGAARNHYSGARAAETRVADSSASKSRRTSFRFRRR